MTIAQDVTIQVLKLGGALLTQKDAYCVTRRGAVNAYGQAFAAVWPNLAGNLVLVLGGGSYGHGVAHRHGLHDVDRAQLIDASELTLAMSQLRMIVTRSFRSAGIPTFPFQAAALLSLRGCPHSVDWVTPIRCALRSGLLPVLSGDLVLGPDGTFGLCSSDLVCEAAALALGASRVIMATDVTGVLPQPQASEALRRIIVDRSGTNPLSIEVGASKYRDVTGGMRLKLEVLTRLAARGVTSHVLDGRDPIALARALLSADPGGTAIIPGP